MKTAVQKLSFATGGDFIADTRREVELYLRPRTLLVGRIKLYAKTFVALTLMLASWATLIFVRPGLWAASQPWPASSSVRS